MKLVCLHGSPRSHSDSAILGEELCRLASAAGVETLSHRLADLNFSGCKACFSCKGKSEHCVLQDDLTPVLEDVRRAEIMVMTTPVYFGEVTAQLKAFIDRTYCFLPPDYRETGKSRLSPDRKLIFCQTQGAPDEKSFAEIFPRYEYFFKWFGYTDNQLIRACGTDPKAKTPALQTALDRVGEVASKLFPKTG